MRPVASTALRVVAVVLVALAIVNLGSVVVFGGPFFGVLTTVITLGILAAMAWWIASRWPAAGTPLTISPFWRTTMRVVAVLVLLFDATQLLLLPFLGWRVAGSVVLLAVIATVLFAASFVGRRHAIDTSLLPPTTPLPSLPPAVPRSGTAGPPAWLPYLPPPPLDWVPSTPPPPAPELERARAATVQTVAAAYAQARSRIVFVVKLAAIVAVAPIAVAAIVLVALGPVSLFLLLLWAFMSLVFGVIFVGWYASLLLIDEQLALGDVPGPEHPLPPAVALYRWGRHRPSARSDAPEPSWDVGTAVAMIRFGRRMTDQARGAARAILFFIVFLAGPGAYIVTFASLLRYAGGTAHIAMDAGAAWGVLLVVWLVGFALLYRYYRQTDRIDARFAELERGLLAIERDFWARY